MIVVCTFYLLHTTGFFLCLFFLFFYHSTFSLDHTHSVSAPRSFEVTRKSAGLIETEYQNAFGQSGEQTRELACNSAAPQWSLTALGVDAARQPQPVLYFSSAAPHGEHQY